MAQGSAYEVEYQILLVRDLGYLKLDKYNLLNKKIKDIIYMLFGLIKSLKNS
jgi:four helix bundle protein